MRISQLPYHMAWESGPDTIIEDRRESARESIFEERAYDIDAMVAALKRTNSGGLFRCINALCDSDRAAIDHMINDSITDEDIDDYLMLMDDRSVDRGDDD
jgi:hypothetical protein